MKTKWIPTGLFCCVLTGGLLLVGGCAETTDSPTSAGAGGGSTTDAGLPDGLLLASAPEGAKPIKALKESAEQGDEVVVRVVVGGRVKPIVDGRASATIVDAGLPNACLGEDDHCETPWDYCCTLPEDVTANLATLQVVDDAGKVITADLTKAFKPGTTLLVSGVVGPRPDKQVLTINATGIYIEGLAKK